MKRITVMRYALMLVLFLMLKTNGFSQDEKPKASKSFFKKLKDGVGYRAKAMFDHADSVVTNGVNNAVSSRVNGVLGDNRNEEATDQAPKPTVTAKPTSTKINTANEVENGETKNTTDKAVTSSQKPIGSELQETDLKQFKASRLKPGFSRIKIAGNLAVDIRGTYPKGYDPKWRFISYESPLRLKVENWIRPNSSLNYEDVKIWLGDYKGKAVLRTGAFIGCDCMADIVISDSISMIGETPQTFKVNNFQKILNERRTGEECVGANVAHFGGGREGQITLSADANGNIVLGFKMETYTAEKRYEKWYDKDTKKYQTKVFPPKVSYRFIAENITVDNEMSPEKANEIIAKEKEAKQRQKDYMAKMTRQSDSLEKVIAKKYPQQCRDCFYSSRGSYISSSTYDQYYVYGGGYAGTKTDYGVNLTTVIKNKCNYPVTFIGIQQFYDEANGYYLKEVKKTMDAGYNYSSDQGIMASVFTSLIGGGSEFNIAVQDKYAVNYASVGSVQWLKIVKGQ